MTGRRRARPTARVRRARVTGTAALVVLAVLGLAGCGSSAGDATAEPTASTPTARRAVRRAVRRVVWPVTSPAAPGGGVFGLIAAITDSTMQVQSDVQTAVTWTETTTVSRQVAVDLPTVTSGSCVIAFVDDASADSPTATSVTITEPVDGECAPLAGFGGELGGGGAPGGMPSGMPTDLPSGMPTDLPSGHADRPSDRHGRWRLRQRRVGRCHCCRRHVVHR